MYSATDRDYPNALSQCQNTMTICFINGISSIINNKVGNLLSQPVIGADYTSVTEHEDKYKKAVTELVKLHARYAELAFPMPTGAPGSPEYEKYLEWHEMVDLCKVTPKPKILWHHHVDGSMTWTLVGIEWSQTTSEEEAKGKDEGKGVTIETMALPEKLDTPKARQMFEAFIDAGRIEIAADGKHMKWVVRNNASKCPVALAYFITAASDYLGLTVVGPSGTERYRRKELEWLFGTSGSSKKMNIEISAKIRKEINEIFKKLPEVHE